MKRALLILLFLAWSDLVPAHEVRPAYLHITQVSETQYDWYWRVPARGDRRLGIYVGLPDGCIERGERLSSRICVRSVHSSPVIELCVLL